MRLALLLPTLTDPAHRRVGENLRRGLMALGHHAAWAAPRGPREFRRFLSREKPDVCAVQFFARGLGWLADARFPAGTRVVLSFQGAGVGLVERPSALAALAAGADRVTAVSKAGLRELVRAFPKAMGKSCVIPNGTDVPPEESPRPSAVRPGAGTSRSGRPFILTVGRLAAYKGTDILLMAFCALAGQRPGLDLVACGPDQTGGATRRFCRRLGLDGRVLLPGALDEASVDRLMRECLFFVLPSRRENMPMALLESMARGKAVIAAKVGGVPEAVRHGGQGLLVPPEDPAALARAMASLAEDAALRRRLGAAARKRAASFDWSRICRLYERLFAGLR